MPYRIDVEGGRCVVLEKDNTYGIGFADPVVFPRATEASKVLCSLARQHSLDLVLVPEEAKALEDVIVKFDSYDGDGICRVGILEREWVAKNGSETVSVRDIRRNTPRTYTKAKIQGFAIAKG